MCLLTNCEIHGCRIQSGSRFLTNQIFPFENLINELFHCYGQRRSVQAPANQEEMLLKYHIIGCARIPNTFLDDSANFTTLLGPSVSVKIEVREPIKSRITCS